LTASLAKDAELKGRLTKWSVAWIVPPFIVLPFIGWWYVRAVPSELWASARGLMPTATRYASMITILAAITFVLSLLTLVKPRKPRFLHFLVAAIALGGLFVAARGLLRLKTDKEYAQYQIRFGAKAFAYATMVQFIVGIWFLVSLPAAQRMLFMGSSYLASLIFGLGILGAAGTIVLISRAARCNNPKPRFYSGITLTILVVGLMVVSRDMLRDSYLNRYLGQYPIQIQWGVFLLFLVIFLAGLFLWLVMIKRYRTKTRFLYE
jgi:hypothetical protein